NLLGASKGAARPADPVRGPAMWMAGGAVAVVLLFVVLPVATVGLISFAAMEGWTVQILPPRYTLANYASLFADAQFFTPISNSLQMATLATVLNVVFGVAAAVVIAKGRVPGRGLIRTLAVLPFAIPGTVIALNL